MSDEMMELQPQEQNQAQPQDPNQPQNQNQDLQQRNDAFTMEQASESLIQKNDEAVKLESEYSPETVQEWQDHKKEAQEGGSDHE